MSKERQHNREYIVFSTNEARTTCAKYRNLGTDFTPPTKISSKRIIDLSVKFKTI